MKSTFVLNHLYLPIKKQYTSDELSKKAQNYFHNSIVSFKGVSDRYYILKKFVKPDEDDISHYFAFGKDAYRFLQRYTHPFSHHSLIDRLKHYLTFHHSGPIPDNQIVKVFCDKVMTGRYVVKLPSVWSTCKHQEKPFKEKKSSFQSWEEYEAKQEKDEKNWVELEYQYCDGTPVANARYEISDGSFKANGILNAKGKASVLLPPEVKRVTVVFKDDPENLQIGAAKSKIVKKQDRLLSIPLIKRNDWTKLSNQLSDSSKRKGNFGIGSGTHEQADAMGKAWLGKEYKIASDGKTLVSKDGLRQYRPPSNKPRLGKKQANFEQRYAGQKTKQWQSNAHLDITD